MLNWISNNPWFLIAQILGVITICFEFASYQIRQRSDKTKYFLVTGIGSFFWMTMFVAIGLAAEMSTQISLIVAGSYSTVRNLTFYFIFKKNTAMSKEAGLIFLLVMIVVALAAGTLAIVNTPVEIRWLHILGMIASITFVICQYLPGEHPVRISVVFYALVVFLTQSPLNVGVYAGHIHTIEHWHFASGNWNIMGMMIESAKIISVAVFYYKFVTQEKRPYLQFAKP